MHRLFLDQNIRIEVAERLRKDGHDVVHASEAGLRDRDDLTLFQWAKSNNRIIVTFDADFAEHAYWAREPHPGVVRMRLEPQTPEHVTSVLQKFLAVYSSEKLCNALVVLKENKVRIRIM